MWQQFLDLWRDSLYFRGAAVVFLVGLIFMFK